MFDYIGAFLFRSGFARLDNVITKRCSKTIIWLLLSRLQGNKPHRNSPEPSEALELSEASGTFGKVPPEPTPAPTGTLRNLLEPASRTYTSTHRNSPPEPTPAHTGTLRNLLEPSSGTCSCDPHRHTPELIWAKGPISLRCWVKSSYRSLVFTLGGLLCVLQRPSLQNLQ